MKPTTKERLILSDTAKNAVLILLIPLCIISLVFSMASFKAQPVEYRTIMLADFTRTVGTAYQPSTTRDVVVQSSVSIAATLSLSGGQSGTINLQTSPDNITYTTKQHTTNNNLGTLIIGLNTNSVQDTQLGTVVPKGYWYKFVSVGTATMSTTIPVSEIHF